MSRGKFASLLIEPVCIAECRRALLLSAEKSHARPIDDGIRNDKERKQMKNWKTVFSVAMTMLLAFSMVGCAGSSATTQTETADEPAAAETTAETADTDASGETVKPVLLVVSFGTSYNDSRDITIGAIENALQKAYPDYEVRRAFTSQIIIDKLAERDGLEIDNVTEAMDRLVADGVKDVFIQPTHVMSGYEYDDMVNEVSAYQDQFDSFKVGKTLLTTDADYTELISIITDATKEYDVDGTAIVFMGHGTEHEANATYAKLQQMLTSAGYDDYFIGTVEATPSLDDMIAAVTNSGATKVVLLPLMIVAGDHANNDMAGDEPDSWKTVFEDAGFEVECVIEGLGQIPAVQQMIVDHAGEAMAD